MYILNLLVIWLNIALIIIIVLSHIFSLMSCFNKKRKCFDGYVNNVELLKRYKELLDLGAITQEEFNSIKNEILQK